MVLWLKVEIVTVPLGSRLDVFVELRRTLMVTQTHFLLKVGIPLKIYLSCGPLSTPLTTSGDQEAPFCFWGASLTVTYTELRSISQ